MNPYLIISLLVAWGISLFGVGTWQNTAGHLAERSSWQTRENGELRTANAKIIVLEDAARKAEKTHADALAEISTEYERQLTHANQQRVADAAAVRSGTLRLRDPNPTGLRACGSIPPETCPAAGGRYGGASGELSAAAVEFLLGLVSDADDVARQLFACQQVIVADRQFFVQHSKKP